MKYKLVQSPPNGPAAKHGFNYAIQIDATATGNYTTPAVAAYRGARRACENRLGKQYMIRWQRPGKTRKWFMERRRTFYRFYFKSDATRTLVLMCM